MPRVAKGGAMPRVAKGGVMPRVAKGGADGWASTISVMKINVDDRNFRN